MENPIKIRWFGGKPPDFRKHLYRKKKPLRFSGANTTCAPVSFTREEWQAPCSEGGFLAEGSNPKNAILWGSWLKIYLGNPQWCQLFVASDPRAVDDFFVEKVKVLVKIFLDTSVAPVKTCIWANSMYHDNWCSRGKHQSKTQLCLMFFVSPSKHIHLPIAQSGKWRYISHGCERVRATCHVPKCYNYCRLL